MFKNPEEIPHNDLVCASCIVLFALSKWLQTVGKQISDVRDINLFTQDCLLSF